MTIFSLFQARCWSARLAPVMDTPSDHVPDRTRPNSLPMIRPIRPRLLYVRSHVPFTSLAIGWFTLLHAVTTHSLLEIIEQGLAQQTHNAAKGQEASG